MKDATPRGPGIGNRSAFTLTEILLALALIVAGIVPLLELNTVSRRRGQQGESYVRAQMEADRILAYLAGTIGYLKLDRILGSADEATLDAADPLMKAALGGVEGVDASARDVRRQVRLVRADPRGLLRLSVVIRWKSTAPEQELEFGCDRFLGDPRKSLLELPPYTSKPTLDRCN